MATVFTREVMMRNVSIAFLSTLIASLACAKVDTTPVAGTGGSMRGVINSGGAGGDTGTTPRSTDGGFLNADSGTDMSCGEFNFKPIAKTAVLLLVLDHSGSMDNPLPGIATTKWQAVTASVDPAVQETQKAIQWGLKLFPTGSQTSCAVSMGVEVPVGPMNYPGMSTAVRATLPDGDGTPTGDVMKEATTYLGGLATSDPKYILLATDGDPSCGANTIQYSVAAVQAAVAAGIETFVVGVGTGSHSSENLDMLALAGRRARGVTNPLDTKYFPADSPAELVTTLKAITGQIASCIFDLMRTPPDEQFVNVKLGSTEIPLDVNGQNGWNFTGASKSVVTVAGSWCQQIQTSSEAVSIVFGCKPPIIE